MIGERDSLASALSAHRDGFALQREFHVDQGIFERELEAIWRASWLFAGPSALAGEPGDFFTFELGDDSLIVVRAQDGALRALHNTCRHRGMRVCDEQRGHRRRWVCPYHQWSYALDGSLLGCGGMEDQLERGDYGLHSARLVEIGGLVYVWLGPDAQPFDQHAHDTLAAGLAPQGLDRGRVASQIDYTVAANWKLIWENNRECWHCHAGHPEYIRANFDAAPDTERAREMALARAGDHERALAGITSAHGVLGGDRHSEPGLVAFPSAGRWWSADRTPLAPGWVTESLDGAPVAPLMGDYVDYDVGTLRVRTVPNFWCHASADHAVLTRLLPLSPHSTMVSVQWLVDRDARAGEDYELDALLPFWKLTSEQDWSLCERNHAGVRSPAYTPGPYSERREYNVAAFVDWYLGRMAPSHVRR